MQINLIGILVFLLSALLLALVSLAAAGATSDNPREGFWIALAFVAMQLGTITALASLVTQLNSAGWIAHQAALSLAILFVLPKLGRQPPRAILEASRKIGLAWLSALRLSVSSLSPGTFWSLCVIAAVLVSGAMQLLVPISGFDDRMYHASRVLYWIQNASALPFTTHNDRQVVFSFGSELFFLWPILFTKTELVGRVVFWLGYPAAGLGLYVLARELGIGRAISAAASLVWLTTPIVLQYSVGLSPEPWMTVFVLGSAFWTVRAAKSPGSAGKYFFLAAANIMVALGIQFTALALIPAILLIPPLILPRHKLLAYRSIALGLLTGLLASGIFLTLGPNQLNYGNPFGPVSMRQVHTADLSFVQIYTHTVRLPFLLLEFPVVPWIGAREGLANWGNGVIALLGADKPLPLENSQAWPGTFAFSVPQYGSRFSLAGIAWLPVLAFAFVQLIREIFRRFPAAQVSSLSILFIMEAPLLAGIVFEIRWQEGAVLPARYLIAPFALGIVTSAVLIHRAAINKMRAAICLTALLSLGTTAVSMFAVTQAFSVPKMLSQSYPLDQVQEPFTEALSHIPSGSHILLVADQAARDYALFAPSAYYANQVTSWGKLPFESGRMRTIIEKQDITHVLIQDDQSLDFHWAPAISTVEMTSWLANQSDLTQIPLKTPGMRLFARPRRIPSAS